MTQPIRPILGDLALQQVQLIQLDEEQVLTPHAIPALEGDFLQRLGRRATAVELTGVQSGPEAREGLNGLRERYRAGEPVVFASDIVSATQIGEVLIDKFEITERAGRPDCFEYRLRLRELTQPTQPTPEEPPPPEPDEPDLVRDTGALVVNVVVEGSPDFDFSRVDVTVSGAPLTGPRLDRQVLAKRTGNRWTEDPFPAGGPYTIAAIAAGAAIGGEDLAGSATTPVEAGQTAEVTITLRDAAVALRFLIHFRFDSAFIEPCLKRVLRQVAQFASENPDLKLIVVGHTDLSGPPPYNQSLSERRARSAFAMLRFRNNPVAAIDEWDALRKPQAGPDFPRVNDVWGAREYQQMLQDLGRYNGRIDGKHGPLTDAAVRGFQNASGIPETGKVDGDATWPALIKAYLGAEDLGVDDGRFLPNCPGEILKWLGCGELDPVRDTQDAWRPNRRTEFLFARIAALPADVAEPDTFKLPKPGAVAGGWCLNESGTETRCCFAKRYPGVAEKEKCPATLPRGKPLTRRVAEPAPSSVVRGFIHFEDGTPYANREYVLTASDGEYMDGEQPRPAAAVRAGTPIKGRTDAEGRFAYPDKPKTPGVFTLEIDDDVVTRLDGAPLADAKGPVVCKRMASGADSFDVVIVSRAVADVVPSIEMPMPDGSPLTGVPEERALLVRKAHTFPARRQVVFRASPAFSGSGTVTVAQGPDRISLFDVPAGGSPLQFDGTANVFTDAQLLTGVTLFAEGGPNPSANLDDAILKLQLTVSGQPGFSASLGATAVKLTLDVGLSRPAPGSDPVFLSETDKIQIGRFTQVRDANFSHERTMIRIGQPLPAAFDGELTVTPMALNVEIFAEEIPADGQAALKDIDFIQAGNVTADGLRLFVEGLDHSAALVDSGVQLGLRRIDADGDRVNLTMVRLDLAPNGAPGTAAANVARFGLWNTAYDAAGELVPDIVQNDARRFHVRVRDLGAPAGTANLRWHTLHADGRPDDAPAAPDLTLPETAAASHFFISRGVMLVTNDLDLGVNTPSGLPPAAGRTEPRRPGQSDYRMRRARIDGFVRCEYAPRQQAGVRMGITTPVFNRNPDERRRVRLRVIRYLSPGNANFRPATNPYIAGQMARATTLWSQVGLQIEADATQDRIIPAGAIDPLTGIFPFDHPAGPFESAVWRDLLPITADNTLTVVFVHLTAGIGGYGAILDTGSIPNAPGPNLTMGNRFFAFVTTTTDLTNETLAHELHHVVFNRFDSATDRQFFTLNTSAPDVILNGLVPPIPLPDVRIYRRVQNLNSPDPNNDAAADNIVNWYRRLRTSRFPAAGGLGAATATTGNTFTTAF